MSRRRHRGFTLVELFLVIAILGILALIAMPLLRDAVARADAARVRTDARQIHVAALQFREEEGHFPPTGDWGQVPPGLDPWLSESTPFDYKDVEYRLIGSGEPGEGERLEVQVRYAPDSPIGDALFAFRGESVAWTRTRTTFFFAP